MYDKLEKCEKTRWQFPINHHEKLGITEKNHEKSNKPRKIKKNTKNKKNHEKSKKSEQVTLTKDSPTNFILKMHIKSTWKVGKSPSYPKRIFLALCIKFCFILKEIKFGVVRHTGIISNNFIDWAGLLAFFNHFEVETKTNFATRRCCLLNIL